MATVTRIAMPVDYYDASDGVFRATGFKFRNGCLMPCREREREGEEGIFPLQVPSAVPREGEREGKEREMVVRCLLPCRRTTGVVCGPS
jgi:hypothetical protein